MAVAGTARRGENTFLREAVAAGAVLTGVVLPALHLWECSGDIFAARTGVGYYWHLMGKQQDAKHPTMPSTGQTPTPSGNYPVHMSEQGVPHPVSLPGV